MEYQQVYHDGEPEEEPLIQSSPGSKAPPDKGHAVFMIVCFLGLASLLPWNFFITAKQYFDYKLRNTSLPESADFDSANYTTHMQTEFESYLSVASNGSNLFFMFLTLLLVRSVTVKTRIVVSTVFMMIIFAATTSLVEVDTDSWQESFLILTLILAVLMSGAQAVLQGSVLGLAALFTPKYLQSAMIGQAVGGTFSAVVSIATTAAGGDPIRSALIYFLTASVVTLLALISYLCLYLLKYSRYFMITNQMYLSQQVNNDIEDHHIKTSKKHYFWSIFKKTWMYCISLWLVFLVSLAVFPAVGSLIKSTSTEHNQWTDTYFNPVVCFLLFNLWDFIGRLATFVVKFPGPGQPRLMLFLCVVRMAFIPLIMLCNAKPRYHLPVVFDHDAYPAIFIGLMGLTNGYLGTLCMSFGPIDVQDEMAEGAGMMLALSIILGLATGSCLSILCVHFL